MNLINEIDQYLIEEKALRAAERKDKGHHPSDLLSCNRQLFYKWSDEPVTDPESPGNLLKMKMGDIIHEWVYEALTARGFELVVENEDNDGDSKVIYDKRLGFPFRFKTDARFVDEYGIKSVIEIKSSFGRGVKDIQLHGPKDTMLAQAIVYMCLENVTRTYFIFLGRDNGYRTQYIIDLIADGYILIDGCDPDMNNDRYLMVLDGKKVPISYENIVRKLKIFEGYYENGELPPRDYMVAIKNGEIRKYQYQKVEYKPDWQCSYCRWKSHCWEEELKKYSDSNNSEMFGGVL